MCTDDLSIPVISAKGCLPLSLSANKPLYNPTLTTIVVCLSLLWSTGFYPMQGVQKDCHFRDAPK